MNQKFLMKIGDIIPSQLYINTDKLRAILEKYNPFRFEDLKSIPVKKIDGEIFFTDGHTRALVAHMKGYTELYVEWEEEDLDWEMYKICISWCKNEKINSISDLANRITNNEQYEGLWIERCNTLQKKLDDIRSKMKEEKESLLAMILRGIFIKGKDERQENYF